MKKSILIAAAALAVSSFGLLSGFDSDATATDILAKAMEAGKTVTETTSKVQLVLDADLAIPDMETSFGVKANGDMSVAAVMEPMAASNNATFTIDLMGQQLAAGVDLYMVTEEDGSLSMYTNTVLNGESDGWQTVNTGDEVDIAALMEQAKNFSFDVTQLPLEFALDAAPELVNNVECYKLTTTATVSDLVEIVKLAAGKATEMAGEEAGAEIGEAVAQLDQMQEVFAMFEGLCFNLTLDIDTQTYRPMYLCLDMDGSDWASVAPIIASLMDLTDEEGNIMQLNLGVNDLFIDFVYDYETPVTITVPEEAFSSAAELDVSDLEAAFESEVAEVPAA